MATCPITVVSSGSTSVYCSKCKKFGVVVFVVALFPILLLLLLLFFFFFFFPLFLYYLYFPCHQQSRRRSRHHHQYHHQFSTPHLRPLKDNKYAVTDLLFS
jgi:hypothetical protein